MKKNDRVSQMEKALDLIKDFLEEATRQIDRLRKKEIDESLADQPVLDWMHVPMGGEDSGWNQLECYPDHRLQPALRVTRGRHLDASVFITCKGDNDEEVVIADVIIPFRDNIAACSICAGDGCIPLIGDTKTECPWCLGEESTAMDSAKHLARALYWSWLRSPNGSDER